MNQTPSLEILVLIFYSFFIHVLSPDHCRILVLIPLVIVFQVQRLVTPIMLQRKRQRLAVKRKRAEKNRQAAAEYAKILAQRQKEAKEAKEMRRKRSASLRESRNSVKSS